MTRSVSVLDGLTCSSGIISPVGAWYWRKLRWVSSSSSSIRTPLRRSTSITAQVQNAASSAAWTSSRLPGSPARRANTRACGSGQYRGDRVRR